MQRQSRTLFLEPLEARTLLSTCHVTRLGDATGGFGLRGDLRYCIDRANNMPGPDSIDFKVTGSIFLYGQFQITSDINIRGPGADLLIINGQDNGRIFAITPN